MSKMKSSIVFRSAAIAGIASALLLALVSTGAQAKGPPPNPFPVNCKFDGTFFPPTYPGAGGPTTTDVLSTALGECKGLGQVNLTGILEVDLSSFDANGCADIASIGDDMIVFNKKGDSLNYYVSGQQCLRTADNTPASPAGAYCGNLPGDPHTSNLSANFNVLGGTGLLAAATGGGGVLTGTVDHCAATFPFGNSFKGTMSGSANVP